MDALLASNQSISWKLQEKEFDVCWLLDDYAGIYLRDIPLHLPTVFTRHYLFSMQNNFVRGTGLRSWFKVVFINIQRYHSTGGQQ